MIVQLNHIGQGLEDLRKGAKLTQSELGALIGVKKNQISKWENGLNSMSINSLQKILKALNKQANLNII